eukprot:13147695-Alexandrium_andersonii.AAC.1
MCIRDRRRAQRGAPGAQRRNLAVTDVPPIPSSGQGRFALGVVLVAAASSSRNFGPCSHVQPMICSEP